MNIRPYQPGDAATMAYANEGKVPPSVDDLAQAAWSFTAVRDGTPIACGGLLRLDPWRMHAWALFAESLDLRAMVEIRAVCAEKLRLAELDGVHCIEAEAPLLFQRGHNFLRGLGFRCTGFAPGRTQDGACFVRFARTTDAAAPAPIRESALLALLDRTLADTIERRAA